MTESNYNVFLCYHTGGGTDYALHLWEKLPHIGITPFINIRNIDAKYKEESDEYRKIIDKAIVNCSYFIIIMTRGFKDREEVIREYKLARDNKRTIIHCKYVTMGHRDCIVVIDGKKCDLYNIHYVEFNNNSTLYIGVTDEIEGVQLSVNTRDNQLNRELFKEFFEPIYSDISNIMEIFRSEGYDVGYSRHIYNELRKKKAFHLKKYENKKLLGKIDEFYKISEERKKHLGRYPDEANRIINQCVESIGRTKSGRWSINKNRIVCIDVKFYVVNNEGKTEEKDVHLSYDVLYLEIGKSLLRGGVNRQILDFSRVLLHNDGGKAPDITYCWSEIYSCIERKAKVDTTLKYLRDSVKMVKTLGDEILREIENEFS